eukprot:COSAG05_NODE_57_length_23291_cov_75.862668_29_plen_65_part_00
MLLACSGGGGGGGMLSLLRQAQSAAQTGYPFRLRISPNAVVKHPPLETGTPPSCIVWESETMHD